MSEPNSIPEAADRAIDFMAQYSAEPPQVAVILAASRMDFLVSQAIRGRLLPCPEAQDSLLDTEQGVGSFATRITLAHRLGIIDSSLARALHLFRKIRNDFAHSFDSKSLDEPPSVDRITELSRAFQQVPSFQGSREGFSKRGLNLSPTAVDFMLTSAFAIAQLEEAVDTVTQVDADCASRLKWSG